MKGIVRTFGNDGKKEVFRSYDMIAKKSAEKAKKFLLNGFINSYDTKVNGCVESATVFAKIKAQSGRKAVLNETFRTVKLEQKFLTTQKKKESRLRTRSKNCKVELTIDPIDPMAQTAQVPHGNIKMNCG